MENITFYEQIKLFLENKRPRKPTICIRRPKPAQASMMHAYACTNLHTQLGFYKPMKGKLSALMLRFGMNLTSFGSRSKPLFSQYIKPYMAPFQNTQKIRRKNLRFTRNSESNREFFTKQHLVNFLLIGTFSSLDLQSLRLLITFIFDCEQID